MSSATQVLDMQPVAVSVWTQLSLSTKGIHSSCGKNSQRPKWKGACLAHFAPWRIRFPSLFETVQGKDLCLDNLKLGTNSSWCRHYWPVQMAWSTVSISVRWVVICCSVVRTIVTEVNEISRGSGPRYVNRENYPRGSFLVLWLVSSASCVLVSLPPFPTPHLKPPPLL